MAQWQIKIDFTQSKQAYRNKEISLEFHAEEVAKILTNNLLDVERIDHDMRRELQEDVIPLFEEIAEGIDYTEDDFDNALEALYDWADTALDPDNLFFGRKMAWIVP